MMRYLYIGLLLLVALGIFFLSHYIVYISIIRFFDVTDATTRWLVAVLFYFLSVSFLIASILAHYIENDFTRMLYFLAGLWIGSLLYLIIATIIIWVFVYLMKIFGIDFSLRILASIFLALAFVCVGYGVWVAEHPRIKLLTVALNNLPANWKGKTLVQLTDVHLGMVYGPAFINSIVDRVNSLKPEAVFITGDYFDAMDGRLGYLAEPLNRLEAPRGIYFVTGNHETYLGVTHALAAIGMTKVRVLNDEKVDLDGLSVVGVSYPLPLEEKNISQIVKKLNPASPSILLFHEPTQIKNIQDANIDLMLTGHTHDGQLWPLGFISKIIYKKYTGGLNKIGGTLVYTSPGTGTWGPPMRIGSHSEITAIRLE